MVRSSSLVMTSITMLTLSACSPEPEVSWNQDIRPIIDAKCARCHSGEGPGLGSFTELQSARAAADRMLVRLDAGTMPPPVAGPECRDYVGSEHLTVSDEDKDLIRRWVELEMPEGNPDLYSFVEPVATELSGPDLTVTLPSPYTPSFSDPVNPGNEYRCFFLEHGRDEPFYITGMHPVIDNASLVHHIVLTAVTVTDGLPDDYDPAVGIDCIDDRVPEEYDALGGPFDSMITGWAPGMLPVELDTGDQVRGIPVLPNQMLMAQMHYFLPGSDFEGQSDQSGFSFRTASEVDRPLRFATPGTSGRSIAIPTQESLISDDNPNGEWTLHESTIVPEGAEGYIHAAFPHMHNYGTKWKMWLEFPDGSETCISQGSVWDFNNQLSYVFKEPVAVPGCDTGSADANNNDIPDDCEDRGARLHLSCTYENTTDQTIYGGERTDEEMCFVFIQAELTELDDDAR